MTDATVTSAAQPTEASRAPQAAGLPVLRPIRRVDLTALLADPAQLRALLLRRDRVPVVVAGVDDAWPEAVGRDPLAMLRRTAHGTVRLLVNRTPPGGPAAPGEEMSVADFLAAVFDRRETARVFGLNTAHFPAETVAAFQPPQALLDALPIRNRYFGIERGMLFVGNNSSVEIHYDREWNDLLHIALAGRRRITVFGPEQNIALHKLPLISDSALDFDRLAAGPVGLDRAEGYQCVLQPGEMLVLPARYWHFIEYIEPSAAISYSFYTNRITWALGTLNGLFYNGFSVVHAFHETRWFRRWGRWYARSRARLAHAPRRGALDRAGRWLGLGLIALTERAVYGLLWLPMLVLFLARYRGGTNIYGRKAD